MMWPYGTTGPIYTVPRMITLGKESEIVCAVLGKHRIWMKIPSLGNRIWLVFEI